MKHKHAEAIKAWADGAVIQCKQKDGSWLHIDRDPTWDPCFEYRIMPIPEGFFKWDPRERIDSLHVYNEDGFIFLMKDGREIHKPLGGGIPMPSEDIVAYAIKKKSPVVRWQWIVRPNRGTHKGKPELTARFYESRRSVEKDMGGMWDVLNTAEWTRTVFEE